MTTPSPLAGEGDSPLGERGEGYLPLRKHARTMRKQPTEAERRLWTMLRDRRFSAHKFRRQVPMGPFIADFLCYDARLIVEADGGQHCESAADARRTAWLESQDFRVLRFWNHEILSQPRDVMDRLYTALITPSPRSAAPSRPLPQGERVERATDAH
jgi:very-short-patch-repair endonuclease